MGSLGVGWSRVPVRCVREDLLESAWAGGFRVGPCVRGPCGGPGHWAAGTGRAGTHWGACGRGGCGVKGGLDAVRAHRCAESDDHQFASCRMRAYSVFCQWCVLYLLILGCAGKAAYLSARAQPLSLCRSPPSPLAAPRFPLSLLRGVAGGDRAVLLPPRRFRSQGRSPAAEGAASPPTAFSVGTWSGGGEYRLSVWPCWYPSYSREYSWESSGCVCLHPCPWRARCVSLKDMDAPLCPARVPWRAGLDECVWEGRVYTCMPWVM